MQRTTDPRYDFVRAHPTRVLPPILMTYLPANPTNTKDPHDHNPNYPLSSNGKIAVPTVRFYCLPSGHGKPCTESITWMRSDSPTPCVPLTASTAPPPDEPVVLMVKDKEGLRGTAYSGRLEPVASLYGPGAVGWFFLGLSSSKLIASLSLWNEINLQWFFTFGFTLVITTLPAVQFLLIGSHVVQAVH